VRYRFQSWLPGMIRLVPDAEDGLPRYGLRPGARNKGRDPIRRPVAAAWGYDPVMSGDPGESIESSEARKYYAYCPATKCGTRNLVDCSQCPHR
jgi:hypothetical protein